MIQVKNVVDALYGMIGWRKDLSDNISISSSLTASETGLYYQDAHPLLTLKNIKSIAPDFSNREWDEWSATVTYHKGDIVGVTDNQTEETTVYKCLKNDTTGDNPTSSNKWEEIDPFSVWLEEKTRASIANAVNHFIYSVMPKGGTKSIEEHRLLFNSVSRINDRVENKGNLVGLEVHPIHAYDVCVRLHKVGLQAVKPTAMNDLAKLKLYIKSSNDMLADLYADDIDVGGYSAKWMMLDTVVANTQGGQTLYAYYKQGDLAAIEMEAVNRTIDWSKKPCSFCSSVDYYAYLAWSKFIEVHPFFVTPDKLITVGEGFTFDQQSLEYVNRTNFGLNIELSVFCDYTDFMIRNKSEFVELIMKQMAADMLKEFAYNPNIRANRNSVNVSRTEIMAALDGTEKTVGLFNELETLYKGLNVSMRGLDKVCRPCHNNGLRYTTT